MCKSAQARRVMVRMIRAITPVAMTPERWGQVEEIFHAALSRGESERVAFLVHACAGDLALRREVESLLARQGSTGGFLDGPAVAAAAETVSEGGASLVTGRRLGAYQVHERIGIGGMGEVYRARDTKLGRDVAIKILPKLFTSDPDRLARFEREARVLASLNHPHIGAIYGLEDADGVPALVLELVPGQTLNDRIAREPIPLNETLILARQIADALEAAHEKGIVHRDLKPANIKITPAGVVKVLDFGLAKAASDVAPVDLTQSPTITVGGTQEGVILGTAAYMSPEQARGRTADKRADVWAFGVVLYEMLTGRPAFEGESISDVLAKVIEREPDWTALPAPTPPRLIELLRRCVRKDPKMRLQAIGDARIQIEELISGATEETATVVKAPTTYRSWRVHVAWASVLLAAVVTAIWLSARTVSENLPAPNAVPVIVLMDSPLPGRVYDPRTLAEGGTNADDVTDVLRDLGVAIRKENTSAAWHREEQVVGENPDLIVAHLSCLLDARVGEGQTAISEHLVDLAENRFIVFLAYVAARNPHTRFIVYSRSVFQTRGGEEQWVATQVARLPVLKDRLNAFTVPGGREKATFRDPQTAQLLRARVAQVFGRGPKGASN
jgi:serine/threonine protein kinase